MHTFNESTAGSGVPAFLAKLWRLVEDSETDNLICWRSVSTKNWSPMLKKKPKWLPYEFITILLPILLK